jgi:hypothetical protein
MCVCLCLCEPPHTKLYMIWCHVRLEIGYISVCLHEENFEKTLV